MKSSDDIFKSAEDALDVLNKAIYATKASLPLMEGIDPDIKTDISRMISGFGSGVENLDSIVENIIAKTEQKIKENGVNNK